MADMPTEFGLEDTVRIDEHAAEAELDPLPSHQEIQAVNVDDVTLQEFEPEASAIDSDHINADPEPLDVGNLLGDESVDVQEAGIEMLEGQESFIADEESLQTVPDPETGEPTLPYPESSEDKTLETIDLDSEGGDLLIDFEIFEDDETEETS